MPPLRISVAVMTMRSSSSSLRWVLVLLSFLIPRVHATTTPTSNTTYYADPRFAAIEKQQGDKPFGKVLDAGTGIHSLRWIATLESKGMTHYTGVTADPSMLEAVQQEERRLGLASSRLGQWVLGNWFERKSNSRDNSGLPSALPYPHYDVILVDYLIGAIDRFSPYKQDQILPMLLQCLNPNGGRLYIIGLEPIPEDDTDHIVYKVFKARDAAKLLGGQERPYREYPLKWLLQHIRTVLPELKVVSTRMFHNGYTHERIVTQINMGRKQFPYFENQPLEKGMTALMDDLEAESLQVTSQNGGSIQFGVEYVVTAERRTKKGDDEL